MGLCARSHGAEARPGLLSGTTKRADRAEELGLGRDPLVLPMEASRSCWGPGASGAPLFAY